MATTEREVNCVKNKICCRIYGANNHFVVIKSSWYNACPISSLANPRKRRWHDLIIYFINDWCNQIRVDH